MTLKQKLTKLLEGYVETLGFDDKDNFIDGIGNYSIDDIVEKILEVMDDEQ